MLALIEIQTPYPLPIEARQLKIWVNQTLTFLQHQATELIRHRQAEITIRVVDTVESQYLNTTWRHCPKPTNVLSFPFAAPPEVPLLGDIIICAPLVAQEAQQQHKSLSAHWAHLIIHGTLHILGYVHDTEPTAQIMESIEINILKELGYPNPYELIEV